MNNAFKNIFLEYFKESPEEAFLKIGIPIIDKEGNFRPLDKVLEELAEKWRE